MMSHRKQEHFMHCAMQLARQILQLPFGAVIVERVGGQIVARSASLWPQVAENSQFNDTPWAPRRCTARGRRLGPRLNRWRWLGSE